MPKYLKNLLRPVVKEIFDESIDEHNRLADEGNLTQETSPKEEKQIIAEVMMSAGPRKSEDSGLGEDACGLILRSDLCFFWIADGTSESATLEDKSHRVNFSSRILAQGLGENFRKQILNSTQLKEKVNAKEDVISNLLKSSLDGVMEKWSELLNQIQSTDKVYLDSNFSEATGDIKDFSSTFLCGVLTTNGHLQVGCYGDSPFLVKSVGVDEPKIIRPENYRFFMRLNRGADNYFFNTSKNLNTESCCFEGISLIVAGSDGIGRLPELVQALAGKFSFGEIRSNFALYDPNTKDDKVLCILSLESF
jgi:hypothetical protein